MDQGYFTIAAGRVDYLEMAVDLALSLRSFDHRPVSIACDLDLAREARNRYPAVFDAIEIIPSRYLAGRHVQNGVVKFSLGVISPHDETVFLDADSLIVSDTEVIWRNATEKPITLVGGFVHRNSPRQKNHHGFSTHLLMTIFGLERYQATSSALFHFRRGEGAAILEECFRCYEEEVFPILFDPSRPEHRLGEELALGIMSGRHGYGEYPDPVPIYRDRDLAAFPGGGPVRPVVAMSPALPPRAFSSLMREVRSRRRQLGLPPEASIPYWRERAYVSLTRRFKRRVRRVFRTLKKR